jgi:hypothetical protein
MTTTNSIEEWKAIPNFPGYEVSNHGQVRSYKTGTCKLKKPGTIQHGYQNITLQKDGKSYTKTIHRIVLTVFDREPMEGEVCRHLDGNPKNNHIDNLCWGTCKENIKDMYTHGTLGGGKQWTPEEIDEVKWLHGYGWYIKDIAEKLGVGTACISNIINGKSWQY